MELTDGRITYDGPGRATDLDVAQREPAVTAPTAAGPGAAERSAPRRREAELTFLRFVPGDSVVHRMWAGTKLIVAAELALAASIAPNWVTLGVLAAVVAIGLLVARIPLGAFPRLPRAFYGLLLLGLFINALATTKPVIYLGPLPISLGALSDAVRLLALAIVLVLSAALVGWTTRLGAVAPALSRLARPLRVLRLPVDEWIVAIALALRCLPLLVDEMRTLAAARRLRHRSSDDQHKARRSLVELHDLVSTSIIVSLRRAHDLADAITARGGIAAISNSQDGSRGWRDVDHADRRHRDRRRAPRRDEPLVARLIALRRSRAMSSSTSPMCVINARWPSPGQVVSRASGSRFINPSVCANGTSVSAVPCQQCTGTEISSSGTCHGRARSA